jgi:polyphosphate kinase
MPRNLDRRVELMFPIEDADVHRKIMQVLDIQLEDTERARLMLPDGQTVRVDRRGKSHLDCQQFLWEQALADAHEASEKKAEYRFEPADRLEG